MGFKPSNARKRPARSQARQTSYPSRRSAVARSSEISWTDKKARIFLARTREDRNNSSRTDFRAGKVTTGGKDGMSRLCLFTRRHTATGILRAGHQCTRFLLALCMWYTCGYPLKRKPASLCPRQNALPQTTEGNALVSNKISSTSLVSAGSSGATTSTLRASGARKTNCADRSNVRESRRVTRELHESESVSVFAKNAFGCSEELVRCAEEWWLVWHSNVDGSSWPQEEFLYVLVMVTYVSIALPPLLTSHNLFDCTFHRFASDARPSRR